MINTSYDAYPLVSVIIPCFNHGRYVVEALESIWAQAYPATEGIVVDNGSTDNTKEILEKIQGVKYIYQKNQGLSAARNTGIKNSKGNFLIFLDADDWLLPRSIETNIRLLQSNKTLAFVSGAHEKIFVETGKIEEEFQKIDSDHYLHLLQGNYIGMHATVTYRRSVFNEFLFDITLRACEDYDLYLNISRKYPVLHHTKKIAAYRIHTFNMSGNIQMMLFTVLKVLDRQKDNLRTNSEKKAYKNGQKIWKEYYCSLLYKKISSTQLFFNTEALATLIKYQPELGLKYILKNKSVLKSLIKKNAPAFSLRWLHKAGLYNVYRPTIGDVKWGDLNRQTPFSIDFGYDRGGPVDRYYIENFLKKEGACIKGRALEIGDNEYTLLFGGNKVLQSDILHIDATNTKATFVGDISNAPHLPDNAFDCIVLTQTLHLIYDFKGALATCHRILKPGGVLLLTSPGITPIASGAWKETWYWSFTDKALKRLVTEAFPVGNIEIETFGNVFVATAFLYGTGISEVTKERLEHKDPQFQVIITVKAVKGIS